MKSFSQRKGIKPVKSVIQVDSMDNDLRISLWNALTLFYWKQVKTNYLPDCKSIELLCNKLWMYYFKRPIDTLKNYWVETYNEIREYFFKCLWYEVYDFIEFIANNYDDNNVNTSFMNFCNSVLEREVSAYRFVAGKIIQITSEAEISEIEEALEVSKPIKGVHIHLKRALELLADRKSPDYRNSIKESISAVESICTLIAKEGSDLGTGIKENRRES
jgi:hypothetical protein